jgi:hypothetical protein
VRRSVSGIDKDKDRAVLGQVFQTSVTSLFGSGAMRQQRLFFARFLSEKTVKK